MLDAVRDRPELTVQLLIDDEVVTIDSSPDAVEVVYGPAAATADPTQRSVESQSWRMPAVMSSTTWSASSSVMGSPVRRSRTHSGPMTVSMIRLASAEAGSSPR